MASDWWVDETIERFVNEPMPNGNMFTDMITALIVKLYSKPIPQRAEIPEDANSYTVDYSRYDTKVEINTVLYNILILCGEAFKRLISKLPLHPVHISIIRTNLYNEGLLFNTSTGALIHILHTVHPKLIPLIIEISQRRAECRDCIDMYTVKTTKDIADILSQKPQKPQISTPKHYITKYIYTKLLSFIL